MNDRPEYQNLDALKARLALTNERLQAITTGLDLPTAPQALQQQVIDSNLPANLQRLVLFLFANNGSRSDKISAAIAISNISDTHTKPKQQAQLSNLGLTIYCEVLPAVNRFGALTSIGHIFIRPLPDNKLWQPMMAANAG
jgi:hypothetical protein